MIGLLSKIFGTKHDRDVKRIAPLVDEINERYEELHSLSDDGLRAKTAEFRGRLAEGETLDDILPEAYACVKEACRRLMGKTWDVVGLPVTWDMIPYDVQLIGGIVLHEGKIAEMATGEGKTLVATMPLYLNALEGKGVHLVTVNDYLARRDSEWMGEVFRTLGLTVGCIQHDMYPHERRDAYNCDITYGTNNEFGFDYLRDNMARRMEDRVQRGHHYAIVDEVDSVLIDEARTPLIISGPVEHDTNAFAVMKPAVDRVVREQTRLVNQIMAEAEQMMESDPDNEEIGVRLLQVKRGAPKNKRFLKVVADARYKKLMNKTELDFIRDKRMSELDDDMYFSIDEKGHNVEISEKGRNFFEKDLFLLPDLATEIAYIDADESLTPEKRAAARDKVHQTYAERSDRVHQVLQLLKAYSLYEKDVEYVVQDGKVIIVDEFTGRLMPGRRYSDGLHSAIEAKENLTVEGDTQTLATITLQNYFRLYKKLAGMTGTAETEAGEFYSIYKLDVIVIPTNAPVRRIDMNDVVFRTKREKYNAIINEIVDCHKDGQPVLVGTVSIEVSETLSRLLKRAGIPHKVLNAKFHQQEAEIIARAGQVGAVTIATNMAGRGTDIKLGPGVPRPREEYKGDGRPGGLHIVGTERHESRRIDRQLRGRAGRQGDPGSSRFYLSLEDDLMRLFGSDRIAGLMTRLGVKEGEVIEHPMLTSAIERAQKRVEAHNFDIRKHLLEYDDVMNQQREVIYDMRLHALEGADLKEEITEMIEQTVRNHCETYMDEKAPPEDWNVKALAGDLSALLLVPVPLPDGNGDGASRSHDRDLPSHFVDVAKEEYAKREEEWTPELLREVERRILIDVIDDKWRDHLYELDQMKSGIGLRGYGQKDPLIEYKKEAFNMFMELLADIKGEVVRNLFRARLVREPEPVASAPASRRVVREAQPFAATATHAALSGFAAAAQTTAAPAAQEPATVTAPRRAEPKVGRNEPCWCGSKTKYKKCHGAAS
jgi:preprotein translocase subunit SecA